MTSASRKHAELVDFVFGKNHSPAWAPKFGGWNPTLPAFHPTRKHPMGSVFARLPLMRFGLMHFDVDPDVQAICAYPFEIQYWSSDDDGVAVKRSHIPDVAILMRDERVIFIDYIPVAVQSTRAWQAVRDEQIRLHYAEEFGSAYVVHDERRVYAQPLFANVQTLWRYLPCKADPPFLAVVRDVVMETAGGLPISAMSAAVRRRSADVAKLGEDAAAYVFTAVMQLISEGRLTVDMSLPITAETVVEVTTGGVK